MTRSLLPASGDDPNRWLRLEDDPDGVLADALGFAANEVKRGRMTWDTLETRLAPGGEGYRIAPAVSFVRAAWFDESDDEEEAAPTGETWEVWLHVPFTDTSAETNLVSRLQGDDLRNLVGAARVRYEQDRPPDPVLDAYEARLAPPLRRVVPSSEPNVWLRVQHDPAAVVGLLVQTLFDALSRGEETWDSFDRRFAPDGDGFSAREYLSCYRVWSPDDSIYGYPGYGDPPLPDFAREETWAVTCLHPRGSAQLPGDDLRSILAQARPIYEARLAGQAAPTPER